MESHLSSVVRWSGMPLPVVGSIHLFAQFYCCWKHRSTFELEDYTSYAKHRGSSLAEHQCWNTETSCRRKYMLRWTLVLTTCFLWQDIFTMSVNRYSSVYKSFVEIDFQQTSELLLECLKISLIFSQIFSVHAYILVVLCILMILIFSPLCFWQFCSYSFFTACDQFNKSNVHGNSADIYGLCDENMNGCK